MHDLRPEGLVVPDVGLLQAVLGVVEDGLAQAVAPEFDGEVVGGNSPVAVYGQLRKSLTVGNRSIVSISKRIVIDSARPMPWIVLSS